MSKPKRLLLIGWDAADWVSRFAVGARIRRASQNLGLKELKEHKTDPVFPI